MLSRPPGALGLWNIEFFSNAISTCLIVIVKKLGSAALMKSFCRCAQPGSRKTRKDFGATIAIGVLSAVFVCLLDTGLSFYLCLSKELI